MTWQEVRRKIESDEYAVRLGVASGKSVFRRALAGSVECRALACLIRKDETVSGQIIDRIMAISETDIDYRYENPWDIALAAYLFALKIAYPAVAPLAAEIVLRVPLTWWARDVALSILGDSERRDETSTTYATYSPALRFAALGVGSMDCEMAGDVPVQGTSLGRGRFTRIVRSWRDASETSLSIAADGGVKDTRLALSSLTESESGTQVLEVV